MLHRLYANGAISVNSAVASGMQVEPLEATMALPLKCTSLPPSVSGDGWRQMCSALYSTSIVMNLQYFQNNKGSAPEHLGCSGACWHLFRITVGNQLFVKKARQADRTCTREDGEGRGWAWTLSCSVVVEEEEEVESDRCVRGMVQAWYFPAHFVILTSNWGTTYVGVILMQTGLRDQLVIYLWWERTRYGFGQTTGRKENETQ